MSSICDTCLATVKVRDIYSPCTVVLPKFSSEPLVQTELAEPNRQFGSGSSFGSGLGGQF